MKIRNKPDFAVEGLPLKPGLSIQCLPHALSPFLAASLELGLLEWEEFAVGFFRGFKMLILQVCFGKEIQHQTRFQKNRLGI